MVVNEQVLCPVTQGLSPPRVLDNWTLSKGLKFNHPVSEQSWMAVKSKTCQLINCENSFIGPAISLGFG